MLETAVRRRYPINAERAAKTVNRFLRDPDPRVALRAAAIAAVMEGQNQKDEHKIVDVSISTRHAELDAIAADLGLDVGLIEAVSRKASSGDSVAQERSDGDANGTR